MRKIIMALLVLSTTACATPPQWLANAYDRSDICQDREFAQDGSRLKPSGYKIPDWCSGAGTGPVYVTRAYGSNRPLTKTQVER